MQNLSWLKQPFFAACLLFLAQAGMAAAPTSRFTSVADQLLGLQTRKVDAALFDSVRSAMVLKENPDLAMIDEKISPSDIAAAFRLKDHDLSERFNRFVAAIRQDGTLAEMRQRWYESEPTTSKMPKLSLPTTGPLLRVGTYTDMGLPFMAIINGQFYGFEVELAQRFAIREGYRLEFRPMDFANLLASLVTGKTDVIISDVTVTEERKKQVAFSQPYAEEYLRALVRASDLASTKTVPAASLANPSAASASWLDDLAGSFNSTFVVESRWKLVVQGLWVTIIACRCCCC